MRFIIAAAALFASAAQARTATAADSLTIAIAGPMTGEKAKFGLQFRAGAEAAVADINATGGVLGKTLVLDIEDDRCDPKEARNVAQRIGSLGAGVVIGHYCSSTSIPASAVYNEQGIVQISPASTAEDYTDKRPGEYSFRVCGRDDQQGAVAGAYIAANYKDKNVAILDDNSTYGRGLAQRTKAALNGAGKAEVFYDSITAGEKDFSAVVSRLKQMNVDLVYLGGYHREAGLIVRQMREQGMTAVLMGGDALVTNELGQIAGEKVEGTLMTFAPDPRKNPGAAEIVQRFKTKGVDPEGYVLYSYAAIQAWQQAAVAAKSTDSDKIVKALYAGEFSTVIGKFKFDAKGDPGLPTYVVYRWNKQTYDEVP